MLKRLVWGVRQNGSAVLMGVRQWSLDLVLPECVLPISISIRGITRISPSSCYFVIYLVSFQSCENPDKMSVSFSHLCVSSNC